MISLRPLVPQDQDAFQDFVRGMSDQSRLHRFLAPVKELAPASLQALTHPDQVHHLGLVAVDGDRIVGEGRVVTVGDDGHGEFAIAVSDEWQRQGIGTRILGALSSAASRAGITRMEGEVLRTNDPMMNFMRRAGFRFRSCPGDARLAVVERDLGQPAQA